MVLLAYPTITLTIAIDCLLRYLTPKAMVRYIGYKVPFPWHLTRHTYLLLPTYHFTSYLLASLARKFYGLIYGQTWQLYATEPGHLGLPLSF